ncbi:invasion associated locus B family protein [Octadecabacter sp.]|nr:invasion associated locus B family protein [Octadecabacter sp.]
MTLYAKSIATITATLLAGAVALPLAAQQADTPADAPLANPPAQTEDGFNLGEPVDENGDPIAPEPQAPQVGEQYLAETFNDWAIRCVKTEDDNDPCQMYQLMSDGDGNNVAEIAIVSLPDGGQVVAGATIVVPLETLLTQQITLRVDGGQARRFPFDFCNAGGCVTRVGLSAEDIASFRRGAAATLTLVPAAAPDQTVVVTMSLSGFTAAFEAASQ